MKNWRAILIDFDNRRSIFALGFFFFPYLFYGILGLFDLAGFDFGNRLVTGFFRYFGQRLSFGQGYCSAADFGVKVGRFVF